MIQNWVFQWKAWVLQSCRSWSNIDRIIAWCWQDVRGNNIRLKANPRKDIPKVEANIDSVWSHDWLTSDIRSKQAPYLLQIRARTSHLDQQTDIVHGLLSGTTLKRAGLKRVVVAGRDCELLAFLWIFGWLIFLSFCSSEDRTCVQPSALACPSTSAAASQFPFSVHSSWTQNWRPPPSILQRNPYERKERWVRHVGHQ